MHFTQVLSIAHRPPMKRQNMSGGAPLAHKVYFANRKHPCLYGPVHFFLVGDIALRIYKCFGTPGEGAVLHFEEEPPYFITGTQARTIEMSGAAILSHQLSTTKKQSAIQRIGIKVEMVATKIKRNLVVKNKYIISIGLNKYI